MADYHHEPRFGVFLTPAAQRPEAVVRLAQAADRAGIDFVSVQDHPYQPAFLDAWTLLSVIAARTSHIRVFPSVANLALRPPAVLARGAASLDLLSGGRVELGLGAGGFPDAAAAMGGPRWSPAESVAALGEAIEVIRSLWTPERRVRFDGDHFRLAGARPGPAPAHPIGIWLGVTGDRMVRLAGRAADGWVVSAPYVPPDQLREKSRILDDAAREAGRDPAGIHRVYHLSGTLSGTLSGSLPGAGDGFPQGPPRAWAEQLAELAVTTGVDIFSLVTDAETSLRRFAEEVAPAVRGLVAKERAGGGPSDPPPPSAPPAPAGERVAPGGGLDVTPTPDPGQRLSPERVWDESTRPVAPPPPPGTVYTGRGRAGAQHLIDVHDQFRRELAQVRDLVEQVAAGEAGAGEARSAINLMAVRQNRWTLGTYCESYCRAVTTHHTLEDATMFPELRRADSQLEPVIDRLGEEHEAIAGVLDRVDAALVTMVGDPSAGIEPVRAAVDLLTDALLSHLSYEERELVEPLARWSLW